MYASGIRSIYGHHYECSLILRSKITNIRTFKYFLLCTKHNLVKNKYIQIELIMINLKANLK